MNFKGVIFFLGIYSFFVCIFSILNILYSLYFNSSLDLNSYFICFLVSFVFGLLACFFGNKHKANINLYDQITLILLSYIFLPLLLGIPYFFGSNNFSFLNSYFESISGFTSTGFSTINDINFMEQPFLIWRSSTQWIGGLFFLISIISTLGLKKVKIKPIYLVTGLYESGNYYKNFFSNSIKILTIYFFTTVIIFILYILFDIKFFDAFNLSLTVISAGGFLTENYLSQIISNKLQIMILSSTLLLPIFNFFLFFKIFSFKFKYQDHIEDFYLAFIVILLTTVLYFFFIPNEGLPSVFLMITSCLSTSGINLYSSNFDLSLFLILLTIIGGSVLSTSSGFKYIRLYILFKTSLNEMHKLVKPRNIFNQTLFDSKSKIAEEDIKISFFIFIFFILGIFVLWSILSMDFISFENSFKLSILTLTNTTSSNMFGFIDFNFYELSQISKLSLIVFMILGKIEFIAILMLIKKLILRE